MYVLVHIFFTVLWCFHFLLNNLIKDTDFSVFFIFGWRNLDIWWTTKSIKRIDFAYLRRRQFRDFKWILFTYPDITRFVCYLRARSQDIKSFAFGKLSEELDLSNFGFFLCFYLFFNILLVFTLLKIDIFFKGLFLLHEIIDFNMLYFIVH